METQNSFKLLILLFSSNKSTWVTLLVGGWMLLFTIRAAIWLIERNRKG